MVEIVDLPDSPIGRVNLIDYRQAGPGPRCIDAAALECAIRTADAVKIETMVPDETSAIAKAFSTYHRELALLKQQWHVARADTIAVAAPLEGNDWEYLSHAVVRGAKNALELPDVSMPEYVLTCLLFGLRQLRYPLKRIPRIRIAAWVGALYAMFRSSGEGLYR